VAPRISTTSTRSPASITSCSARSYDEHEVIDAGERVEVVEIRGATALVMH